MLGRETRVPDHLTYHIPEPDHSIHEYASELVEQMKVAHEILQEKQWQVQQEDSDEPPVYQVGDWVWIVNYRRCRGQAAKLQPKFVGPYAVVEVMPNHTYKLERSGQVSVQNEARLKPYWASPGAAGEAPPLLEPRRQTATRGRRRHGPEYKVVVPQTEDLVRQERSPPLTEVRPLPPTPCLPPLTPNLPPTLPNPNMGSEVRYPPAGGVLSGDKENETTHSRQEALPVEPKNPPVITPPPSPSRTPSGGNEEGEEMTANGGRETPQVEPNNPPVSIPPPPVAIPSSPAGTSPSLQWGQRTRRPPAYLKDFVCDRVTSGSHKSLAGCRMEKLAAKRGSYELHENINFCEGEVVGRITTPGAYSSGLAQHTRCPVFSYADSVKRRRTSSTNIQA